MGSTSYMAKSRVKGGSSVGSDKDIAAKLRRTKIRRPGKMNEYGLKRIPDYTELAYKEAVSKLRYFLSGNYAPSVRSYGGSASIKNLDESDGDALDKKYPSSAYLSALDYKPRPRLTAKYATLYADSLKNYNPTTYINASPASGGAATGSGGDASATNPDVVQFIQKQEEYIEQLERESQYCRDELNNLLGKVKEVISENEHLHDAQKNRIISRMLQSGGSETDDLDDTNGFDSDKTSPMKTRKPKKSLSSSKIDGPNIMYESRISELEAQLTQSQIDLKKLQDENNENKRKLASGLVDSTCLDGFKRQIDNLQRDKSSLEAQISRLKLNLEQREDADSGARHTRTDIERQLREDKSNLEADIRRLKEELDAERGRVRELCGEGARRALRERSATEQRYTAQCDELSHELSAQYDNVAKLQLELERQRRDENELKRAITMKNAAIDELKMELKNKTASLQADLAQAHAEKASMEEELASARLALERHQRQAKHDTNRQNSEIQSLRQRLDRADADLVHSRRENLRLSEQIAALEKELNMKNLGPMSPEKKKEKEFSTMIESMEDKHAHTVAELESMIHSQNSLMEKLTGECRLLTDKLDDASRRHKQELATLQRQVDSLGRSLQGPPALSPPTSNNQAPTSHMPTSLRNDEHPTPDAGRVYSGAESTGNAEISRKPSNANVGEDRIHSDNGENLGNLNTNNENISNEPLDYQHNEPIEKYNYDVNAHSNEKITDKDNIRSEDVAAAEQNPQYVSPQDYVDHERTRETNENYDQANYNQDYQSSEPQYQEQEYQQQYAPNEGYTTEGQYEGNYEQYPDQTYAQPAYDANAQNYEGQYENYTPDETYQNVQQNLENPTYQQNQDYSQYPESQYADDHKDTDYTEKQKSNSPAEKVSYQS